MRRISKKTNMTILKVLLVLNILGLARVMFLVLSDMAWNGRWPIAALGVVAIGVCVTAIRLEQR